MNIVLYAGDNKYYKTLLPIAREVKRRGYNFLFLYSQDTQLRYPQEKDRFAYDGKFPDADQQVVSQTLGLQLPFKPDVLILARERWQPEQSIIYEFKTKFNTKIGVVEVSSHLVNNIENRLEMLSRMNYPQNMVDYFFEHSEFAKERRLDCMEESYRDKIIVTGNPRFTGSTLRNSLSKYDIDTSKQQILFWGVINTTRPTALKALETLAWYTKHTHQIFYKCYPGEPYNPKFKDQFNPFAVEGVQVIYDEDDIFDIANLCKVHIGQMSSVFNFAFYFGKTIVNLDSVCHAAEHMNNLNTFTSEVGNGVEDSARFWMNIWNIPTVEQFKEFIDEKRLEKFKQTNAVVMDSVKAHTLDFDWECNFLTQPSREYGSLIKMFDEYELDGKAPDRILNFLENEFN